MGRFRRSWMLTKAAARLIGRSPGLLVFPLMSIAVFLGVGLTVLEGGRLVCGVHFVPVADFMGQAKLHLGYFVPAVLAGAFVASFASILNQASLIGCVLLQMEGKPHRLKDGLRLAWSRRRAIVKWTLVTLTVGALLQMVEGQFNRLPGLGPFVGRWVFRLVGASWTLVTFLIVPVIVFEEQPGVWAQLRRSGQLFKRSWSEQVLGRGMITGPVMLVFLGLLGIVAMAVLLVVAAQGGSAAPMVFPVMFGVMFSGMLAVSPLLQAIYGTYVAVLYGYTVTGMLPQEFSPDLLPTRAEGEVGAR